MTLATVMVSLGFDASNDARLEVAGQLTERFDAGVVGVAAAQFSPPLYFTTGQMAQDLIEQGQLSIRERLAELEARFRGAIKNRAKYIDWRSALDFPTRFVVQEARCADIVVTGGLSPAFSDAFALASPKDLVMQTGRPLLIVPEGASWLDLRTVLVAWKDSAEARRAAADSLPLLRQAKTIVVAEIPDADSERSSAQARVDDVVAWLSRHGLVASARVPERRAGVDTTQQLEDIADDLGASLIVAGAYGHSRFRELVLGGMTQHLVTQSSRCVLLSH
jgi:nucleotide-binding universal stress UspA family protein